MKIVIRFLIINYSDVNYVLALFSFQVQLNNLFNVAIELLLNEISYDFRIRDAIFSLIEKEITAVDLFAQRLKYRQETIDAIVFVNAKAKIYYDARHMSLLLNSRDYVYLRLHHEYQLFDKSNKKINQQRCDSFLVKRRVERLAYELKLSSV